MTMHDTCYTIYTYIMWQIVCSAPPRLVIVVAHDPENCKTSNIHFPAIYVSMLPPDSYYLGSRAHLCLPWFERSQMQRRKKINQPKRGHGTRNPKAYVPTSVVERTTKTRFVFTTAVLALVALIDPGVGTIPVYSEEHHCGLVVLLSRSCRDRWDEERQTTRRATMEQEQQQHEHQLQQAPPQQQVQQSLEGNGHIEPREPPHENSGLPKKVRCVCQ